MPQLPSEAEPRGLHTVLDRVNAFVQTLREDVSLHSPEVHLDVVATIKDFNDQVFKLVIGQLETNDELRRFFIIVDTALATLVGMLEDRCRCKMASWRLKSTT